MRFFIKKNIIIFTKEKFVENLLSFEREKELCWRPLYQNPFHMFMKTLDEI